MMVDLDELADDPDYVWVTNSGIDGKNSHHHLMHAKYLLPLLPHIDYMLVYAGLNDVGMWLYDSDFDPDYLDDPDNWASRVGESFRLSNFTPDSYPWYKHLELWKRASVLKDRFLTDEAGQAGEERKQGRIVQDAELKWMEEERERRHERAKILVPRAKMDTLPAALDGYEHCLREIIRYSRENGTVPIFMAQTIQHQFLSEEERERLWMGAMDGGKTYVQESQMLELLQQYNERMRQVAADEGVFFIDLPALLGAEDEDHLFYDGVHFNEKGCRLVARLVAGALWQGPLGPHDS
jgi:lysophospholipase L1-like esterase